MEKVDGPEVEKAGKDTVRAEAAAVIHTVRIAAAQAVKESSSFETTGPRQYKGGMTWIIKRTRRQS